MADLDPALVGRDRLPTVKEGIKVVNDRTTNWTICPCPTQAWADLVFPDLEPAERLQRLERELLHVLRLDEDDPIAVWRERADTLVGLGRDAHRAPLRRAALRGPGDRPDDRAAAQLGLAGRPLPDRRRARAHAQPPDGGGVHHARPGAHRGRRPARPSRSCWSTAPSCATSSSASRAAARSTCRRSEGGETLRTILATDPGAARLGECALVDREGRIGGLGTIFYDTLLDENAASHIALGQGFPFVLGDADRERGNASEIHIDFMIGSDQLKVTGLTTEGDRVPVLVEGRWQV